MLVKRSGCKKISHNEVANSLHCTCIRQNKYHSKKANCNGNFLSLRHYASLYYAVLYLEKMLACSYFLFLNALNVMGCEEHIAIIHYFPFCISFENVVT